MGYQKIDKGKFYKDPVVCKSCVICRFGEKAREIQIKINEDLKLSDFRDLMSYILKLSKTRFALLTRDTKIIIDEKYDKYQMKRISILEGVMINKNRAEYDN